MPTKKFIIFTLLLSGSLFLSACLPENPTPTDPVEEPTLPVEIEDPDPYPYPDPGKEIVRPTEPTEPYPDPEPVVVIDPYPGVDNPNQIQDPNRVIIVDGFSPLSIDKDFNRGPAFVDNADIVLKESFPVQVELVLIGNLPTPCHQLRVVTADPDADGLIEIEVYSVSDPEKMCIQVLEPFEALVPLGDFTEGNYTISINEEPGSEFKIP